MYKLSEYLLIIDYNKVNFINKYNFTTKDLINIASPIINGKGGGQPNIAIMGGENKDNYIILIDEIKKFVLKKIKSINSQ